ncbi:MAG: leucine--tRNA ligase [Nanoarchaeota archaeon]
MVNDIVMNKEFDFSKMEKKWQKKWEESKVFEVEIDRKKKKYYVLEMYPYPSGSGLHIGHAFNFTLGDIYARFRRMQGYNVLYPTGYDSFGLPAENAAIKAKSHPRIFTDTAIANFIRQQKSLGLSYDWTRKIESHDVEYYKWDQYFFLEFLKKGLAYRKKSPVNFCPKCNSVLANEQVHGGKCWVHKDVEVEIKHLEQWFLKTTKYADELLEKVRELNWPERIKLMQENWIGKSYGVEINFEINGEKWPIFTTRPDTIFGVTFMVISAQHPKLMDIVTKEGKKEVIAFLKRIKSTSEKNAIELEKEGTFTGSFAINPLTNEKVPVYAGNFVVADYGSGMVMAVPAHDQRDFEFAKKYKIPIKIVIKSESYELNEKKMSRAFVDEGILIDSGKFNGIMSRDAIDKISFFIEKNKIGKKVVQYKLRDWLLSRQRYWGAPIPVIYCDKCGVVPVPKNELPVLLPEKVRFGEGNPLVTNKEFLEVKCPKCSGNAMRETDTMDTFFDSSWYYLRFTDPENKKEPFETKKMSHWMPVDFYVGGAEHACMHLIYARFFTKVLRDLGYLKFDEPFVKLFNQGMIHAEDGFVMSKSRGNVIDPLDISEKYGVDSFRMFLVSVASPDKDSTWSSTGIESIQRFIVRVFENIKNLKIGKSSEKMQHKLNKAIKGVTSDIENLQYNLAVIKIRELFDSLESEISKGDVGKLIKIISLFCPHVAEEIWESIGNKGFVSTAEWPIADEKKINEKFDIVEKAVDKTISDILNVLRIVKEKSSKDAEKVYLYVIPNEIENYDSSQLSKRVGKEVVVFSVNDKKKYDPESKSAKTKSGKPGIYVE